MGEEEDELKAGARGPVTGAGRPPLHALMTTEVSATSRAGTRPSRHMGIS